MKTINTYIYNIKHIKNYINEKLQLTTKQKYTCQPKDWDELRQIIVDRVKNEGTQCDLNDIDVSKITDMSWLFDATDNGCSDCAKLFKDFNGDISQWDVSNVKDMCAMFYNCEKFDCDLSMWNVSKVENMKFMFSGCKKFSCDISKWDVSNVKDMNYMFSGCKKFNQNLDSWNVSNVKNMRLAFYDCPTTPAWYDKKRWE